MEKKKSVSVVQAENVTNNPRPHLTLVNAEGLPIRPKRPWKHVSVSFQEVTPALAAEWLEPQHLVRQRTLKPKVVATYAKYLRVGDFAPCSMVIGVVDKQHYLLDGQHRLQALIKEGMSWDFAIIQVEFDSLDALWRCCMQTDAGSKRTTRDCIKVGRLDSRLGFSSDYVECLISAFRFIACDFRSTGGRANQQTSSYALEIDGGILDAWIPAAQRLNEILNEFPESRRLITRQPVLAAALCIIRAQADMGSSFWRTVAENDGLRRGTPEHALRCLLAEPDMTSTGRDIPSNAKKRAIYARKVISAWNNYFLGKSITHLKGISPDNPAKIEGTPFTGKRAITAAELEMLSWPDPK